VNAPPFVNDATYLYTPPRLYGCTNILILSTGNDTGSTLIRYQVERACVGGVRGFETTLTGACGTSRRAIAAMNSNSEDSQPLCPDNSSEDAPNHARAVPPMWRSVSIALVACVVGIVGGVTFFAPPPPPRGIADGGHGRFITEYDLVTIRYDTPMAFETDVIGLGVTDKEYKECKSSILLDPSRKICTKASTKCYMKKLKYEQNSDGEIQPKYVKDGATEVDCPSGHDWLQPTPDDSWRYNGWPNYCRKRFEGSNTDMNICYGEMTCEEESSQWSAQVTKGYCDSPCIGCRQDEKPFVLDWLAPANSRFWCAGDAPSWYGGPNPLNLSYPSPSATKTTPYNGKFCLQQAALKALSRRGWELIEPLEAFEPNWHYDSRYNNPRREDVYLPKTFKVIKRTPAV